jgi:hypothetical protein
LPRPTCWAVTRRSLRRAVVLVGSVRHVGCRSPGFGRGVHHLRRDLGDNAFILFSLDADGRLLAASGIGPGNAVARDIRLAEMLIASSAPS